jgi:hypothetical protein
VKAARSPLHIVGAEPRLQHNGRDATPAEEMLLSIVQQLREAEDMARRLHQHMTTQTRLLADERGVAFIREERIRGEFGNG